MNVDNRIYNYDTDTLPYWCFTNNCEVSQGESFPEKLFNDILIITVYVGPSYILSTNFAIIKHKMCRNL